MPKLIIYTEDLETALKKLEGDNLRIYVTKTEPLSDKKGYTISCARYTNKIRLYLYWEGYMISQVLDSDRSYVVKNKLQPKSRVKKNKARKQAKVVRVPSPRALAEAKIERIIENAQRVHEKITASKVLFRNRLIRLLKEQDLLKSVSVALITEPHQQFIFISKDVNYFEQFQEEDVKQTFVKIKTLLDLNGYQYNPGFGLAHDESVSVEIIL